MLAILNKNKEGNPLVSDLTTAYYFISSLLKREPWRFYRWHRSVTYALYPKGRTICM